MTMTMMMVLTGRLAEDQQECVSPFGKIFDTPIFLCLLPARLGHILTADFIGHVAAVVLSVALQSSVNTSTWWTRQIWMKMQGSTFVRQQKEERTRLCAEEALTQRNTVAVVPSWNVTGFFFSVMKTAGLSSKLRRLLQPSVAKLGILKVQRNNGSTPDKN